MHPAPDPNVPFFFIIGMARSGTTLLRLISNHHPHMIAPPESRIIRALKKRFQGRQLNITDVDLIISYLKTDRKIDSRWKINHALLKQELSACIAYGGGFNEICKTIYLHWRHIHPKTAIFWIADKNPGYTTETEWLAHTFPEAKFIHLVRDYRDCIASHNRVFKKRSVNVLGAAWVLNNQYVEKSKAKMPERFMTMRYEDLAANPVSETSRMCAFLGIAFDDHMLKFYEKIKMPEKNGDFTRPIHSGNIGKYHGQLTPKQLNLIEWICSKKGEEYGYTPEHTPRKKFFYPLAAWWGRRVFYYDIALVKIFYDSPLWVKRLARRFYDFLFNRFNITTRHNHSEMKQQTRVTKG